MVGWIEAHEPRTRVHEAQCLRVFCGLSATDGRSENVS